MRWKWRFDSVSFTATFCCIFDALKKTALVYVTYKDILNPSLSLLLYWCAKLNCICSNGIFYSNYFDEHTLVFKSLLVVGLRVGVTLMSD